MIPHLSAAHEELEALSKAGPGSVVLGERRHDLRVICDEGRVGALVLQEVAHLSFMSHSA